MKRLFRVLVCLALALCLAGCGGTGDTISFTWYVDEIPANLDPQMARTSAEMIACSHLYSGLYRADENGEPRAALASGCKISADGRTYTFTLQQGLHYVKRNGTETEYTLTAEDFVFAFRRVFRSETNSPYVNSFAGIENAMDVLTGAKEEAALGVYAQDDYTLVIRLTEPDDSFLDKLTLPGAMPCDEAFFESTGGKYGLDKANVISAGEFYLYNWTESGLFIRRTPEGTAINNLRLITNTDAKVSTPAQMIENGKCSAAIDLSADPTGLNSIAYSNTTWSLVFRCDSVFGNAALRKALAAAAQTVSVPQNKTLYSKTDGLVPDGASVSTLDYRAFAGSAIADLGDGRAHWDEALTRVTAAQLKGHAILVPESADAAFVQAVNAAFQKEYGLYCNIETVSDADFAARYAAGDFALAIAPVQLTVSDPTDLLAGFTAAPVHYTDSRYLTCIAHAAQTAGADKLELLAQAEALLLSEAVVTPLYAQNARLLVDPTVSGLRFDPFGPVIDVTYASRTE